MTTNMRNGANDQGHFYAPYIPILKTPTVDTTQFDNELLSRIVTKYGKKTLNNDWFTSTTIQDALNKLPKKLVQRYLFDD